MAVLVLALDRETEDRLLADIIDYGHVIAARPANVRELLAAIDRHTPDVLIVGATAGTLTAELLAASDAGGIRVVALAGSPEERRYVASLGLHEVASADADWAEVERMLTVSAEIPLRIDHASAAPADVPTSTPPATPATTTALPAPRRARSRRSGSRRPRFRPRAADTAQAPPADSAEAMRTGAVIAVWGPTGAPGRTTLAINIAAEIAAAGHTVVLADVDTYSGSIAPSLGLLDEAPGFAAACRLAGSDTLTQRELERIAHRYNSPRGAFWVLTGIGRPSRWPELSAERVDGTIAALRQWTDYVVLDTGFSLERDEEISSDLFAPRRNAATLAALGSADTIVACGLADPVGMARFLRAWGDLIEVIGTDRVHVVMNRVRASAVGLGPNGQVQSALRRFGGIDAAVLVPHDQDGVDAAVLTGRTLRDAVPRSPARLGIRRFVLDDLLPVPADEAARRRLPWPRAWRWRSAATST